MDKDNKATETNAGVIAPQDAENDSAAKIAALETEKAKIVEERDNYKNAYLKESKKNNSEGIEESDEDKFRRIAREEADKKRISEIDKEKETLNQKIIQENKELKLALQNKNMPPAGTTSSTEGSMGTVKNTLVTPDQDKYFREVLKWSDKDIERYKKNLQKKA